MPATETTQKLKSVPGTDWQGCDASNRRGIESVPLRRH
jgi:hypothetical protein